MTSSDSTHPDQRPAGQSAGSQPPQSTTSGPDGVQPARPAAAPGAPGTPGPAATPGTSDASAAGRTGPAGDPYAYSPGNPYASTTQGSAYTSSAQGNPYASTTRGSAYTYAPPGSTPPGAHGYSQTGAYTPAGTQGGTQRSQAPAGESGFFASLRRTGLTRSQDRWIGGVAAGLARRMGIDPIIVRCVWAVVALLTGVAIIAYGLAWLLLPEETDGRIHLEQAVRGQASAGLAGAIASIVAGIGLGGGILPGFFLAAPLMGAFHALAWVALVVVIIMLIVQSLRRRGSRQQPWAAPAPAAGAAPNPPATGTMGQVPHAAPGATSSGTAMPAGDGAAPAGAGTACSETTPLAGAAAQAPTAAGASAGVPGSQPPSAPLYSYAAAPGSPSDPARPSTRRRVPGPGRRLSLLVLAIALVTSAVLVALASSGRISLLALGLLVPGLVTVLLGTGVLISALRGRRGGWMTGLGWLALLGALPALAFGSFLPADTANAPQAASLSLRDGGRHTITVTPQTLEDDGLMRYSTGVLTLDLTGLRAKDVAGKDLAIELGAGSVALHVPEGLPVRVTGDVALGSVSADTTTRWRAIGAGVDVFEDGEASYTLDGQPIRATHMTAYNAPGMHHPVQLLSPAASTVGTATSLTVRVSVGTGDLRVHEPSSQTLWQGWIFEDRWIVQSWRDAHATHEPSDGRAIPGMTHAYVTVDTAYQCLESATRQDSMNGSQDPDDARGDDAGPEPDDPEDATELDDMDGIPVSTLDQLSLLGSKERTSFVDCLDSHAASGASASPTPSH